MGPFDAVLPAGGQITGEFAERAGTDIKALIRLGGQTYLERAILACRESGRVRRIVVVGPEAALEVARGSGADGALLEGETGPENMLRGIQWLREQPDPTRRALIVTTDIPFLCAAAIDGFLDLCPEAADIVVPVVTQQQYEARFPGTTNVFVTLKEGPVTIGGVFLVNPETLLRSRLHLENVFRARKSQLQMARLVGWRVAVLLLTRRLALRNIEARVSQILRCDGAAVLHAPPELAFDNDLPGEYDYARAHYSGPSIESNEPPLAGRSVPAPTRTRE